MTRIQKLEEIHQNLRDINKHTIKNYDTSTLEKGDDTIDLLLFSIKNYDANFTIGLLLTFPKILKSLSAHDWKQLIKCNFPRSKKYQENITKHMQDDGQFADLIFLQAYLKINPISIIIKEIDDIGKEEIKNCINYMSTYQYKFFINESELTEDLNDFYNIDLPELREYAKSLIQQGLKSGFQTNQEMNNYLGSAIN